jgi:hypothetical protein
MATLTSRIQRVGLASVYPVTQNARNATESTATTVCLVTLVRLLLLRKEFAPVVRGIVKSVFLLLREVPALLVRRVVRYFPMGGVSVILVFETL